MCPICKRPGDARGTLGVSSGGTYTQTTRMACALNHSWNDVTTSPAT